MQTLEEHRAQVDAVVSPKLAYNEHLRECARCFMATARGELCHAGVPLFDAIPPVPQAYVPRGIGAYGFEGLDDSMTFPYQGASGIELR
jgi:hypothetical protein